MKTTWIATNRQNAKFICWIFNYCACPFSHGHLQSTWRHFLFGVSHSSNWEAAIVALITNHCTILCAWLHDELRWNVLDILHSPLRHQFEGTNSFRVSSKRYKQREKDDIGLVNPTSKTTGWTRTPSPLTTPWPTDSFTAARRPLIRCLHCAKLINP